MKKEKLTYCYLILFLIFGSFTAQAQQQQQQDGLRVIPKKMEVKRGNLEIELVFDMSHLHMKSVESRTYTPSLVFGKTQLELPKVIIKGSHRYKADSRKERLNGGQTVTTTTARNRKGKSTPIYTIKKYNRNGTIPYKVSVPYREWMDDALMHLREEIYECCGVLQGSTLRKDVFNDVPEIQPKFRYLVPEREPEKHRYEIERAYLDFPQGKSVIDPNFRNNRSELYKINQMIAKITTDRDVTVSSIEMRGYASPESSQGYNFELSSKRAQAMREYFAQMSTIPSNLFRTGVGGEDWETLKILLANYQVAYKNEILRIINTEYDLDLREQKIKALGGGKPYQQIFRELYPKLRRVDCQINFTVRNFTLDEGKERIQKKPKLLSQNEMYQVARTYPEGSREFNETLITAREYFPNNDIANLNGAAAALSEGDIELAEEYLELVQNTDSPEYANCLGVFYTLTGDYDEAEAYLRKAHAAGIAEATHNLNELEKVRKPASKRKRAAPATGSNDNVAPSNNERKVRVNGELYIQEKYQEE
jgi:flagellar motor protein MotB